MGVPGRARGERRKLAMGVPGRARGERRKLAMGVPGRARGERRKLAMGVPGRARGERRRLRMTATVSEALDSGLARQSLRPDTGRRLRRIAARYPLGVLGLAIILGFIG